MKIRLWSRKDGWLDKWAEVDDADGHLSEWRWGISSHKSGRTFYARAWVGDRVIYLHRAILGQPPASGLEVDHIDGNGLNCVRANLEWVTHAENIARACAREPFAQTRVRKPPKERVLFPHVNKVVSKGRVYYYDRETKKRITEA